MTRRPVVMRRLALAWIERRGLNRRRAALVASASGRVLELGCADGRNFAHYRPQQVDSVVAVEPQADMANSARRRVGDTAVPIDVQHRPLDSSAYGDDAFDTVVLSFCLCRAGDPQRLLRDLPRVMVDDAQLLFLEHHRSPRLTGFVQQLLTPLWRRLFADCHLDRDSVLLLRTERFSISSCDRFRLPGTRVLFGDTAFGVARPDSVFAPLLSMPRETNTR